jgi:hypothetical protein
MEFQIILSVKYASKKVSKLTPKLQLMYSCLSPRFQVSQIYTNKRCFSLQFTVLKVLRMVVVDTILRKFQLTAVRESIMDRFVLSKALTDEVSFCYLNVKCNSL